MRMLKIPVNLEIEKHTFSAEKYLSQSRIDILKNYCPKILDKDKDYRAKIIGSFINTDADEITPLDRITDIDIIFPSEKDALSFLFNSFYRFHYVILNEENFNNFMPTIIGEKFAILNIDKIPTVDLFIVKNLRGALATDSKIFDYENKDIYTLGALEKEFRRSILRRSKEEEE